MRKIYLTLFIQVLILSFILGQKNNYHAKQITINNGLSHNTVESVFQDSDGIMWFATHNGLDRYDGYQIKSFKNSLTKKNSISDNRLICINEDWDGFIWIGTLGSGLNRFNKKTEVFENYYSLRDKYSLPNNTVNNIKVFKDSSLWICTNNGLAKYNKKENNFTNYFLDYNNIGNDPFIIYDILKTSGGEIYIATNQDCLFKLNEKTAKFSRINFTHDEALKSNFRKHIVEAPDQSLWVSVFAHGLVKLNPATGKSRLFTTKNSNLKTNLLNGKLALHKNKLWLTTDGFGLIIFDLESENFSNIEYKPNQESYLFSNKVYSIFIDNQDIVWVGTFNEGVNILNPNQLKFSTPKSDLNQEFSFEGYSILSIFEDKKNNLWVGTDGDGLFRYSKNGEIKQYKNDPLNTNSLSSDRIICINQDSMGNLLLGTFMGGLVAFNPDQNKFTRYLPNKNNKNSIASIHVWDIYIDSKNRIWIGLLGGGLDLFDADNKQFIHYGPNTDNYNRINHDNVMGIIEDNDGDIWFGTEGRGINILDNQTNQMFQAIHPSEKKHLSNNNVQCIYEDSKGIIWIGTNNGGLNKYNKKTQTIDYFYMKDGLPSNIIYSIIEDENQNLLLGTAYGLSKFDTKNEKFRNFDINDGLMSYMCNRNAIYKQKNGNILLGTTNGLNIFNPDSIRDINFTPNAFFTNLRIDNKIVNLGDTINGRVVLEQNLNFTDKITIEPQDKIFSIEFAARTYTLPEKCWFKYKLEGFDENWNTTEALRQHITYTNLDPGNYIFKVKASNSDGLWSNYEATLNITIMPSFWQSVWFKLLIALIILFVFYAVYKYKLSIKEKQFLIEKEEQNKHISELEKEKLEGELNNQTFNILTRNRTLLKHKRRLNLLVNKVDEKTKNTLLNIISEIDQEINEEKDWKHIEPRLDKVYNNFMTILKQKNSDLTQSELRIAAYVRMGLSTKEISELLQKTTKAIDNDRYRLRKKLNILQNDSLKNHLLELE